MVCHGVERLRCSEHEFGKYREWRAIEKERAIQAEGAIEREREREREREIENESEREKSERERGTEDKREGDMSTKPW